MFPMFALESNIIRSVFARKPVTSEVVWSPGAPEWHKVSGAGQKADLTIYAYDGLRTLAADAIVADGIF